MAFGKETDPSVGEDTQFKPGESGNPSGKPKGTKHVATWIQEMLNDEGFEALLADPKEGWKTYKGAPMKAIVQVMAIKAMGGDVKAFDVLSKYGWGTKMVHANDPESPITNPADKSLVDAFIENLKNDTSKQTKPD